MSLLKCPTSPLNIKFHWAQCVKCDYKIQVQVQVGSGRYDEKSTC